MSAFLYVALFFLQGANAALFEWEGINSKNEAVNELQYCLHRNLSEEWKGWVHETIDFFNEKLEQTHWQFTETIFTTSDCQIFFVLDDIEESKYRGWKLDYTSQLGLEGAEASGKVNGAVITVDAFLEQTTSFLHIDEDKNDAQIDGWSINNAEITRDPILAIGGALSILIGAEDLSKYLQMPGIHSLEYLENQITNIQPSVLDIDAEVREYLLTEKSNANINFLPLSKITLSPTNALNNQLVYHSFFINVDEPTEFSIPYGINALQVRDETQFLTALGFVVESIDGENIQAVQFEKNLWDLTPYDISTNPSSWISFDDASVDPEKEEVIFTISEPGIYGIAISGDYGLNEYEASLNGEIYTEKELLYRRFFVYLKYSILEYQKQIGIVIILFIFVLAWKQCSCYKSFSPSESSR